MLDEFRLYYYNQKHTQHYNQRSVAINDQRTRIIRIQQKPSNQWFLQSIALLKYLKGTKFAWKRIINYGQCPIQLTLWRALSLGCNMIQLNWAVPKLIKPILPFSTFCCRQGGRDIEKWARGALINETVIKYYKQQYDRILIPYKIR